MPRPRYEPAVQLKPPKKKRRDPSPEIITEAAPEVVDEPGSPEEPESPGAAALDEDQLLKLMLDWPNIPEDEHDSILLGVLESAVEKVGFGDENFLEVYSFFINSIPIRGQKNQGSAYVAFCSCQKEKCFETGELILKSLIRSMRLALTKPLESEDILFLVNKMPEYPLQFATLIEELAAENHSVRIDHLIVPDDSKILETATGVVTYGFKSARDLLENVHRVKVDRRDCVQQVKMMLNHIFTSRRDLIRSHGRSLAEIVEKLEFCPESAVPAIKLLAETSANKIVSDPKSFFFAYALTLTLFSHLDVTSPRVVAELPGIMTLILKTHISGTRMLRDILRAFKEVYENSFCSREQEFIQNLIMDKVVEIILKTGTYEQQLEIVKFLGDLKESNIPNVVHLKLCEKAEGLGIINRVCALLLNSEEARLDKTIRRAIKRQLDQRARNLNEVRIEHPKLFEYMRKSKN